MPLRTTVSSWIRLHTKRPSRLYFQHGQMQRSLKNNQALKVAQWLWAVFIFFIHVAPVDPDQANRFDFPFADKWIHALLFGVLSALSYLSLYKKRLDYRPILLVFGVCLFYGALLEVIQYFFTEERSGDILDWLADSAGALNGIVLARLIATRLILRTSD